MLEAKISGILSSQWTHFEDNFHWWIILTRCLCLYQRSRGMRQEGGGGSCNYLAGEETTTHCSANPRH